MSGFAVRSLPARPDLDSERKRAKQLLRAARRGDPDALARLGARNRSLREALPEQVRLADAQLAIAREYGFRSWPLLVQYFEVFARHQKSDIRRGDLREGSKDWWVKTILAEHRDRRAWTALVIGSFVPRFYGASIEEIFAATVTEDDGRLVVAREHGFARWEDLLAYQAATKRPDAASSPGPLQAFTSAIAASNLDELDRLSNAHPEILGESFNHDRLASAAVYLRPPFGSDVNAAVVAWLREHGVDVQPSFNRALRGTLGAEMKAPVVRSLLDFGADPNWIAPNGYPVLEHALYRYWNGEAVDLIVERAKPRDTFWVSAGVGDAHRLRRYFDRQGKLKPAARRNRPDLMALSGRSDIMLPEPGDDMLLWEAAFVAAVNGRAATFDVLLEHGFDIDMHWGMTLLSFAVGNALLPMVELLVKRGANPDVRGWRPNQTAREMCVGYLGDRLADPDVRRIVELVGGDATALAREVDARRGSPNRSQG